jgi:hypothetical protein
MLSTEDNTYPGCLMLAPVPGAMRATDQFRVGHNRAIQDYVKYRVGAMNGLRHNERGILALLDGIDALIGAWGIHSETDYLAAQTVWALLDQVGTLLNYDLGRLDGAALNELTRVMSERVGIDPDTGD